MTGTTSTWTVVIPVNPPALGKSRLHVPGVDHDALARAIALDTIEAAAQVARVIVVSADPTIVPPTAELLLEDEPLGIAAAIDLGLNAAPADRRAVLLGDLPALRPADLSEALVAADEVRLGAVPDEERRGTTLVTGRDGDLAPSFGDGSWRRHLGTGFVELALSPTSTLRRDVDVADHLTGPLGPRTAQLLASV